MKSVPSSTTEATPDVARAAQLSGMGEMGERIRTFDWSASPLGPVAHWPSALTSTLGICLNSRFPMAVYWGVEGYLFYNDAWRPILGEKHPWALGRGAQEVWPEIWQDIAPLFASVRATREGTWRGDALLPMHRSGYTEECYFDYTFNPIMGKSGVVEGILNVVQETTQRVLNDRRTRLLHQLASATSEVKTVDQVCHRAERTLQSFTHDVPFALLYLVSGKRAQLAACTGLTQGNEAAPEWMPLDKEPDAAAWPLAHAMEFTIRVHAQEGDAPLPGGPWPEHAHTTVILPLRTGAFEKPLGFLVAGASPRRALDQSYEAFFDLLARSLAGSIGNARAFEQEKQRAEALAELNRAKTDFFTNVSHELRTPLTLMLGPLEDELRETPQNSRLELAHRNSLRLLKLVNTLLDFSRIEAGRIQAAYEPVDLAMLTAELASGFRSAVESAGLELKVECAPLARPVLVDVEMWEKIVLNLLSNAFKFTFDGTITVSLKSRDEVVELAVTDTGTGIPAEELPHIFERFHRVRGSRSRTHEGTGIGLALVGELARLHGGTVSVVSEEGRGSTFTVTIQTGTEHLPEDRIGAPRNLASTATSMSSFVEETRLWQTAPAPISTAHETKATDKGHAARILLADDNSDMRDYVARLLAPHYDVTTTADGHAALSAARQQAPDLVLADMMMPQLDGFGLLQELRADPKLCTLPVILLSARAGEEARVEGMARGADDYLVKPFSARELLARVEAHLKLARLRRESEERSAADLAAMARLRDLGILCTREGRDTRRCLDAILETALTLLGTTRGNLQLFDSGTLRIAAHKGFSQRFLDFFATVSREEAASCGAALRSGQRIEVEDVTTSEFFAGRPSLDILLGEGVRAVQSTPLISSRGNLLGMFSTHFATPRQLGKRELWLLDLLARQAADYIERERASSALRESEELHRGIINQTLGGIVEAGPDGRLTMVNDRFCDMVGYPREELLQMRIQELTHPEDLPRTHELLQRLVSEGRSFEIEKRYVRKDGSAVWVHNSVSCIRNTDGSLRSLIAVVIDITARKQAEDALQRSLADLRRHADELAVFNRMAVGRELRMVELKKEINELCRIVGKPPRHDLQFLET